MARRSTNFFFFLVTSKRTIKLLCHIQLFTSGTKYNHKSSDEKSKSKIIYQSLALDSSPVRDSQVWRAVPQGHQLLFSDFRPPRGLEEHSRTISPTLPKCLLTSPCLPQCFPSSHIAEASLPSVPEQGLTWGRRVLYGGAVLLQGTQPLKKKTHIGSLISEQRSCLSLSPYVIWNTGEKLAWFCKKKQSLSRE